MRQDIVSLFSVIAVSHHSLSVFHCLHHTLALHRYRYERSDRTAVASSSRTAGGGAHLWWARWTLTPPPHCCPSSVLYLLSSLSHCFAGPQPPVCFPSDLNRSHSCCSHHSSFHPMFSLGMTPYYNSSQYQCCYCELKLFKIISVNWHKAELNWCKH